MMKSPDGGSAGAPEKRLTARSNDPTRRSPASIAPGRGPGRPPARSRPGWPRRSSARRPRRRTASARCPRPRARVHETSCGVGLISTCPASSSTAPSSALVTSPTGRSGVSGSRRVPRAVCSTTASCVRRSSAATIAPVPSGAGSGEVSQPRAVSLRAVCCELGLGGRQHDRELAQHLRVRMQGVAGLLPFPVVDGGPPHRHPGSDYRSAAGGPCNRHFARRGRPH